MFITTIGDRRTRPRHAFTAVILLAAASTAGVASGAARAALISDSLNFQVSGQPIWGGTAPVFQETLASLPPLGPSIGPGNLVADLGILGDYGIEARLFANLDIGLQARLRNFHLGTVDINFPVNVELNFPDQVDKGELFTISSSFSVGPTAGFTSTADQSELDFSANASLNAGLNLRVCIFTCFIDNTDPSSPFFFQRNANLGTLDLITQTKDNTIINIDLPDFGQPAAFVGKPTIPGSGIDIDPTQDITVDPLDAFLDIAIAETTNISGKITVPDLSQTGSLNGPATLSGKKVDVFADVTVDLDSFFSPPLPPLGIGPFNVSGVTFGVDLFDADLVTKLIADQALDFLGAPKVFLDLGVLGIVELPLGGSVDITAPRNVRELQITPTYALDNTFTNTTIVAAAQQTDISFGRLQFGFPQIEVIPGLPAVVLPGTPGFCLIPKLFGGCAVFIPGSGPITIFPGSNPVNVGPITFNEAIFEESITDSLINANIGGLPLSVGVCDVSPNACALLPLLNSDQARSSGLFEDQQSFAFPSFVGQTFNIRVIPEPATLPMMVLGLAMVAVFLRRRASRA